MISSYLFFVQNPLVCPQEGHFKYKNPLYVYAPPSFLDGSSESSGFSFTLALGWICTGIPGSCSFTSVSDCCPGPFHLRSNCSTIALNTFSPSFFSKSIATLYLPLSLLSSSDSSCYFNKFHLYPCTEHSCLSCHPPL